MKLYYVCFISAVKDTKPIFILAKNDAEFSKELLKSKEFRDILYILIDCCAIHSSLYKWFSKELVNIFPIKWYELVKQLKGKNMMKFFDSFSGTLDDAEYVFGCVSKIIICDKYDDEGNRIEFLLKHL